MQGNPTPQMEQQAGVQVLSTVMPPSAQAASGGDDVLQALASDAGGGSNKRRRVDDVGAGGGAVLQLGSTGAAIDAALPSLADERLAGVPALHVANSCERLQDVTAPSAAPPMPVRERSRGQRAADALPPELQEVAMQFLGSTELQDAALQHVRSSAPESPGGDSVELENFFWDFLEGTQANHEAAQASEAGGASVAGTASEAGA